MVPWILPEESSQDYPWALSAPNQKKKTKPKINQNNWCRKTALLNQCFLRLFLYTNHPNILVMPNTSGTFFISENVSPRNTLPGKLAATSWISRSLSPVTLKVQDIKVTSPIQHFNKQNYLTQAFQLLNHFLPNRLDMDAAKTPIWGDLNEVGLLEAIWNHFIHVMWKVQQILFISWVPPIGIKREVKKGLIKIKIFMEMAKTILSLLFLVALVLSGISVVIIIWSLLFIGKNL